VEIKEVLYDDYGDFEIATYTPIDEVEDPGASYRIWKEDWKEESKSKWKEFDSEPTDFLFELLLGLIKKLTSSTSSYEEMAIKTLGGWIIIVLNKRLRVSEETKTRRNKLVRHLREELERLKK